MEDFWRKNIPNSDYRKCKGPEAELAQHVDGWSTVIDREKSRDMGLHWFKK